MDLCICDFWINLMFFVGTRSILTGCEKSSQESISGFNVYSPITTSEDLPLRGGIIRGTVFASSVLDFECFCVAFELSAGGKKCLI